MSFMNKIHKIPLKIYNFLKVNKFQIINKIKPFSLKDFLYPKMLINLKMNQIMKKLK